MSLNSFVTRAGDEIGRAQAVQAEAAGIELTVDMNPVLLKPEGHHRFQAIVQGKPLAGLGAAEYSSLRERLWLVMTESLERLMAEYQVVVIEGAGSPAEVNLKDRDLVNMRVARYSHARVLLVADIDRGGAFASIVGTLELLEPDERALVKGLVINKFRGELTLLTDGLQWLGERTGVPVVGVIPYFQDISLPEEDSIFLDRWRHTKAGGEGLLDIVVISLPHISNFDDFDPFNQEGGVRLRYAGVGDALGALISSSFPAPRALWRTWTT